VDGSVSLLVHQSHRSLRRAAAKFSSLGESLHPTPFPFLMSWYDPNGPVCVGESECPPDRTIGRHHCASLVVDEFPPPSTATPIQCESACEMLSIDPCSSQCASPRQTATAHPQSTTPRSRMHLRAECRCYALGMPAARAPWVGPATRGPC
jgi:hypothetical protein